MSPWKVFKEFDFEKNDIFWLIFRIHKLCGAKYLFFKDNPNYTSVKYSTIENKWLNCPIPEIEGFRFIGNNLVITISQLQKIRDKNIFVETIQQLECFVI